MALEPAIITYKTNGDLSYKRVRTKFMHDQLRSFIVVHYHEYVEDSGGIVVPKITRSYRLDGSYYFELSLASSGASTIADFLDTAIDARLNTPMHVQDSIEAGRAAKDAVMAGFGYTP